MRAKLIFPATPVTHSLHKKSAIANRTKVAASSASLDAGSESSPGTALNKIALFNDRALAMAIRASGSKRTSCLLQLVSGACNQQRNTKAPLRRRREFPFGNSSRGSPAALRSLIRIRRDFIPNWTNQASPLGNLIAWLAFSRGAAGRHLPVPWNVSHGRASRRRFMTPLEYDTDPVDSRGRDYRPNDHSFPCTGVAKVRIHVGEFQTHWQMLAEVSDR
jgi:hypothetical protein